MRLPGAVGIDFRDRRGVRRGASEILTSLMLVYVANLGMDYVVCGPGAIAGPATHRSSSSAMSRARLERLIEQGDVPFITQPAARASDRDQIAGHAQGIMLRRVPRYDEPPTRTLPTVARFLFLDITGASLSFCRSVIPRRRYAGLRALALTMHRGCGRFLELMPLRRRRIFLSHPGVKTGCGISVS